MRQIDADGLIKHIQTTYCRDCKDCNKDKDFFHCRIEQIIGDIHYASTVDQWHYPSKGEYPKEDELALCLQSDGTIPFIGVYSNNKWFNWYTKFIYEFEPKCWQYIIPPKENK